METASAKREVIDLAIRGLSVIPNNTSSYLNIAPRHSAETRIILVIGSNGHKTDDYSLFEENYVKSLCNLFRKGYLNSQVLAVLPMIRGGDPSLYQPQLERMRELKTGLKFLGVASVCWDELLPVDFDRETGIFGKRDLRERRFVHYSEKAKKALSRFIESLVQRGFDETRRKLLEGDEIYELVKM